MLRLVESAVRHPVRWLVLALVPCLLFGLALPRLELRTDGASLYPLRNRIVERSEADRITFHDPQQVIVLVASRPGAGAVRSPAGLRYLERLHVSLRSVEGVQASGVRSLASLPDFAPGATHLALRALLDHIPDDPAAFEALVTRIRQQPMADGLLLSADGSLAAIYVPIAATAERRVVLAGLQHWMAAQRDERYPLRLLGPMVAEVQLGDMVLRDLARLTPIMIGAISLLLLVTLRTAGGVLVPLVEAVLVLTWTLGAMALFRAPITLVTTIMPVVLMAMAITDEVHLLERLQERFATSEREPGTETRALARPRLQRAVLDAFRDVQGPIIATTVTTAIGFFSFFSATMPPLRDFGLFTGLGIVVAMLLSFTLVPALVVLLPPAWFRRLRPGRGATRAGSLPFEAWAARHSGAALLAGVAVLALCLPGLPRLTVQDSWIDNFDPRSELVTAERDFNRAFWGSYRYDVVVESEPGFFFGPDGAGLVERLERLAASEAHVGGVTSYLTPFRSLASALGETRPIAALSRGQIADLTTMAQMAPEQSGMMQLVTPDGSAARLRLYVNSADYKRTRALRDHLQSRLPGVVGARRWRSSGDLPVALEVVQAIVVSQLSTLGWGLLGIAVVVFASLRRLRATIVALLPVTTSALVLFGGMGYVGMPLGIATSMFASLSLGVGIDFALHMLHAYHDERGTGLDHDTALAATFGRTARAIRWNALVLALGLLVLGFSALKPDRSLGMLLAGSVLSCYGMTLFLLPRLVRGIRVGVALVVLAAAAGPAPARAQPEERLDNPRDPAAQGLMEKVERAFRTRPRALEMRVQTTFADSVRVRRTMWGIVCGDRAQTHLLYVFTEPQVLAGTSLLIQDEADPARPDSSWIYLPAFQLFRGVDPQDQKIMVPGTALNYEDSRGFIPTDKYDFEFADASTPEEVGAGRGAPSTGGTSLDGRRTSGDRVVIGRPRTNAIRDAVGYTMMRIVIDERRRLVTRVDYTDVLAKPMKTYELLEAVRFQDLWLPKRVRVRHLTFQFASDIGYRYWPLRHRVGPDLYRPSVKTSLFLPRLQSLLQREGIPLPSAEY